MKKLIVSVLSSILVICSVFILNAQALSDSDIQCEESDTLVELCSLDLSSTEDQVIPVTLPNGKTGTVTVKDIPTIVPYADHYTLSGSFKKELTFTESSPVMTISAIYSGTVTTSSVSLNKPSNGIMTGLVNFSSSDSTYEVRNYDGDSKTKEAVFKAIYSFPIVGTTHRMDLILRVSPSNTTNNAVLYTNGTF